MWHKFIMITMGKDNLESKITCYFVILISVIFVSGATGVQWLFNFSFFILILSFIMPLIIFFICKNIMIIKNNYDNRDWKKKNESENVDSNKTTRINNLMGEEIE